MDKTVSGSEPMVAAIAGRAERWRLMEPSPEWLQQVSFETTLDLSAEYDIGVVPENVIQAVETALDEGETHYTERPGLQALREAVAHKLASEQGLALNPATDVIISCGGRESMFVALQVLTQPGDEVLVPELHPVFIDETTRLARAKLVPVPLMAEEGFEMKAGRIEACLTEKTRVLVLSNPSNPTGVVISADEIARIAALAKAHDLTIISDESLDESIDGDVRHKSVASFSETAQRTLVVGSFSRLHDLASWRVGYFAGPKSLAQPVRDLKQAMTICTSAMSQYAALEAMTNSLAWLKRRRDELDAKRIFVLKALDELGLPHSQPTATPYVWIDVRSTGKSSDAFAGWLLSEVRVAVTAGTRFGPQGEGYVRLSLWPTFSELEQAMRRMKWSLEQVSGGAK